MRRTLVLCVSLVLLPAVLAAAGDVNNDRQSEAKELSGMSIVGNDEAPKSLYIVRGKLRSRRGAQPGHDVE